MRSSEGEKWDNYYVSSVDLVFEWDYDAGSLDSFFNFSENPVSQWAKIDPFFSAQPLSQAELS